VPGRARLGAGRHRRHHCASEWRDGGLSGCQGKRGAQADAQPPRIRLHDSRQQGQRQGRRVQLRVGVAVPGRSILPLQVPTLRRRAPRIRARAGDRGVRRRSRQLQLPALVPGFQPHARLRKRQAGAHARLPALARRRAPRGRSGVPRRPSRQHQPPAHRRATEIPAQRRLSGVHRPQLRAARPDDGVGEDRRRAAAHRAGNAAGARERAQGLSRPGIRTRSRSIAAWNPRCWTTG
jgi:hypothetical protein